MTCLPKGVLYEIAPLMRRLVAFFASAKDGFCARCLFGQQGLPKSPPTVESSPLGLPMGVFLDFVALFVLYFADYGNCNTLQGGRTDEV